MTQRCARAAPNRHRQASNRQRPHKSTSELLLGLPPTEPLNICTDEHYCFPSSHPPLARSGLWRSAKTQDRRGRVGETVPNDMTLQSLHYLIIQYIWHYAVCLRVSMFLSFPHARLPTYGDRAFPVAAVRIWNSLPQHITSAPSLPVFCSRSKTYFFELCYP